MLLLVTRPRRLATPPDFLHVFPCSTARTNVTCSLSSKATLHWPSDPPLGRWTRSGPFPDCWTSRQPGTNYRIKGEVPGSSRHKGISGKPPRVAVCSSVIAVLRCCVRCAGDWQQPTCSLASLARSPAPNACMYSRCAPHLASSSLLSPPRPLPRLCRYTLADCWSRPAQASTYQSRPRLPYRQGWWIRLHYRMHVARAPLRLIPTLSLPCVAGGGRGRRRRRARPPLSATHKSA